MSSRSSKSDIRDQPPSQTPTTLSSDVTRRSNLTIKKGSWRPSDGVHHDEPLSIISQISVEQLSVQTSDQEPESSSPTQLQVNMSPAFIREVIVISSDSEEESFSQKKNLDDSFAKRSHCQPIESPNCCSLLPSECMTEKYVTDVFSRENVIYISDSDDDFSPLAPGVNSEGSNKRNCHCVDDLYNPVDNLNDPAIITFDPHVRTMPLILSNGKERPTTGQIDAVMATSPAKSSKGRKTVEQQRLENYASTLFKELNRDVFKEEMPSTTELIWNVRLLSTAGRAFYHRKNQQIRTKIELSPKVVDSDERVRNTLAHEMCHLAVWIIDGNPHDQGHGLPFKAWADRVMKTRSNIEITTRHSYEINYKYQWECEQCHKIYGRHSKSIDIKKSACGVCDPPGRLKPLFSTPAKRIAKSFRGSRLASHSPRASPVHLDKSPSKATPGTPLTNQARENIQSDDEVENLIYGINTISLKDST